MLKKVLEYAGDYRKMTYASVIVTLCGVAASVIPYFFAYQLLTPLLGYGEMTVQGIVWRVLAHAVPEGISNVAVPVFVFIAMFFVDWKLGLLSLCSLPQGFDTMVGEGGESLSGGEKQRISIARCILKDAPIVILDEATASVDADNESYIQQAISELCQGKTLLVIAHRLNTIRNADQILVIADGEIAQSGTHQTLMEQPGIYRSFVTVRENSRGWNNRAS